MENKEMQYEILVAGHTGRPPTWNGNDGEDACHRYADAHPGHTVLAWRYPRYEVISVDPSQIKEEQS